MLDAWREVSGTEGRIDATHGGLECGLFMGKIPGLDAISFGPDLHDVHPCTDRDADALLRDPVTGKDLKIPFRGPAAVAAHGRHDEGVCAPRLQLIADRPYDQGVIRDAAAADGHSDFLALDRCRVILF